MAKRKSEKRDLVRATNATFYAKRDDQGQFREMDEVGRSLSADRRQKAKKKVASGYGDQGDRPAKSASSAKRARKTTGKTVKKAKKAKKAKRATKKR